VIAQKSKSRDVLSIAKRLCRDSASFEHDPVIKDKVEDLRIQAESCAKTSAVRLGTLEKASSLASHFQETHDELDRWLEEIEDSLAAQRGVGGQTPTSVEQIRKQQESLKVRITFRHIFCSTVFLFTSLYFLLLSYYYCHYYNNDLYRN